jgi:molybdate transport system substrate-binding protein
VDDGREGVRGRRLVALLLGALILATSLGASPAARADVTLFAAASLGEVITELADLWAAQGEPPLRLSFAASSTLARQIEHGAPADLFLSANLEWMDRLEGEDLVRGEGCRVLARNRLVLVAPADTATGAGDATTLLADLAPDARIAMGDPAHVPAGRYGAAALRALGQHDVLARAARAADVRAALALVARGEAPLGIVYATDARLTDRVRVVAEFPADAHPPIVYPAAPTREGDGEAARVLAFLASPAARAVWDRHGFGAP